MRTLNRVLLSLALVLVSISLIGLVAAAAPAAPKVVVSHRAASGYLPEHTLPAVAMAFAFGPDYIEQDVALTKDGVLMVIHDIYLDAATNVGQVFAERKRSDGRYYVCDFTLAEISSLRVTERINTPHRRGGIQRKVPLGRVEVREMPTFAEEIEMIQGMNKSMGRNIGIYPEIKGSAFHHRRVSTSNGSSSMC